MSDLANIYNQVSNSRAAVVGAYGDRRGDGLRSKTHERAFVQAPARLRANVPSNQLRAVSLVLRRGVTGVSGRSPEFAFLFQIKRKCRNAGSLYHLIIVCSEGRS